MLVVASDANRGDVLEAHPARADRMGPSRWLWPVGAVCYAWTRQLVCAGRCGPDQTLLAAHGADHTTVLRVAVRVA